MSLSKEVNFAHVQRPVPCDACEDEVPGTYYCKACKKTLCEDCEKAHNKFTKGHKVVLRAQIGEIEISILTCNDHGDEVSFHCKKCNEPVCHECVTGKHKGHKLESLAKVMEKKKELLQRKINEIQNAVIPKLVRQEEMIKTERDNYNKKIQHIAEGMEIQNQKLHEELDRVQKERMKNLYDTQKSHLALFDDSQAKVKAKVDICQMKVSES